MSEPVTPFLAPLSALQSLISRYDEKGVIIGGIAASLLGVPRLTADLDAVFLLTIQDIPEFLEIAREEGLIPRIPDAEEFAKKNRVILLRHEDSGTGIDVAMGVLPFEREAVERSQILNVGGLSLRLPTAEDLIILKAVAHRPKDLLDIQGIAQTQPSLDIKRIRFWVDQFAEALEMPELWEQIEKMLKE